ncbi:hypothetical protein [Actinoplanes solisilvae]|uniref:hypothetical protein n=1 Tax=Actinoplanes solisilvae TaxID=2486853 RepID=UPI00196B053C|nr:hypothetical protein [Actinoplanes solisilvae]
MRDTRRQVDELVAALGAEPVLAERLWLLIDGLYGGTSAGPVVAVDWGAGAGRRRHPYVGCVHG